MKGIKDRKKLGAYLDGAANTPLDKRVFKAMKPFLPGFCGNSNSVHRYGQVADQAVNSARSNVAKIIGCEAEEVLFTSGATEANNWVIKGLALNELQKPEKKRRKRIICLSYEHSSVIGPCEDLKKLGFEVEYVGSEKDKNLLAAFKSAMFRKQDTPLIVCCMAVNNETGEILPAESVAKFALQMYGSPTLVDCTQALSEGGKRAVRLRERFPHATYMTFSGHKIYGPTGIGCLIASRRLAEKTSSKLSPFIHGGEQEFGLRGGTTNTASVVGLSEALTAMAERSHRDRFAGLQLNLRWKLQSLNKWARSKIAGGSKADPKDGIFLNLVGGVPYIASVNCGDFLDLPNLADAMASRGVAVSSGSACSVGGEGTEESHVLKAMGVDSRGIRNTVRVSFTKYTEEKDIDAFIRCLFSIMEAELSPRERRQSRNRPEKKTKKRAKRREGE